MLDISNLKVSVQGTPIINELNLTINPGETHVIMGPNGSGKSTLVKTLAGHPAYEVTDGTVNFTVHKKIMNLLEMETSERSLKGLFLSFQYPVEIPGVTNLNFLFESYKYHCESQGVTVPSENEFIDFLKPKCELLKMNVDFLNRNVNEGFSGGEKKKNEILQLLTLNPKLALLDETDSGLDVDALKVVSEGVNTFRNKSNAALIVTHYQRLLNYIKPDVIHLMVKGKIIRSGGPELALEVEEKGYGLL